MSDEATRDEFSVVAFYADDTHRYIRRWIDGERAVKIAKRTTDSPAASAGWITKVIITDGGDFTVFQWQHGRGVTFPART